MKIVLIGGRGTIGKKVAAALGQHDLILAGRSSGDEQVDIASPASIEKLFQRLPVVDACVCTAGTGYYGDFQTMTEEHMTAGIRGKLLGQVNLVLIGKNYLRDGGSFTLTLQTYYALLRDLCQTMVAGSLCALCGMAITWITITASMSSGTAAKC